MVSLDCFPDSNLCIFFEKTRPFSAVAYWQWGGKKEEKKLATHTHIDVRLHHNCQKMIRDGEFLKMLDVRI